MKKILVTGCYGFLAGHLIQVLKEKKYEVVGLARHIPHNHVPYPDYVYLGDMRDKELVEKAVSSSDGVIHIAGILGTQETVNNPYPSVEVNVMGALNVLEACRIWKIPVVQIAVGNHWEQNSYSITKTCAERFAIMYAREHGVRVNIVRALNAYGERQKAKPVRKIIASFITRALNNEPIQIYGDGEQLMDMVHVRDVASVLLKVLENETTYGNVYEAGTGTALTVNEIAQTIINACGSTSALEHLPMRPGESVHAVVKAENPYPHNYIPFKEGIQKTIRWYEKA